MPDASCSLITGSLVTSIPRGKSQSHGWSRQHAMAVPTPCGALLLPLVASQRDQLAGRQTSDQGGNRAYLNFLVNSVPHSGIARLQRSSFQTQKDFSSLIG